MGGEERDGLGQRRSICEREDVVMLFFCLMFFIFLPHADFDFIKSLHYPHQRRFKAGFKDVLHQEFLHQIDEETSEDLFVFQEYDQEGYNLVTCFYSACYVPLHIGKSKLILFIYRP